MGGVAHAASTTARAASGGSAGWRTGVGERSSARAISVMSLVLKWGTSLEYAVQPPDPPEVIASSINSMRLISEFWSA